MKPFGEAKSRLRDVVPEPARKALALAMFQRVLDATASCNHLKASVVLTYGDDVASYARGVGAHVVRDHWEPTRGSDAPPALDLHASPALDLRASPALDLRAPPARGLGQLIDAALPELAALGADAALVLMADLPYIDANDVAQLATGLASSELVLAADTRGRSTNALALRLPARFKTAFGDPDSYALHLRRAREAGLMALELHNANLAHDVDVRDDLPLDSAWARRGARS